jgi:hypothetical protein
MTIQKAIEIVDWWISTKQKIMEHLKNEWHYNTIEEATGVAKMIFDMDKVQLENLQKIRKELVPKCMHPKKFRDIDPSGKLYCVGCNLDL